MNKFLSKEVLLAINHFSLKLSGEEAEIGFDNERDLNFLLNFVKSSNVSDHFKISLAYCCSIIILHPFKNGNHRTSILSAEYYLVINGFEFIGDDEKDKELEKWRVEYEKNNDLYREFFRITCIEDFKNKSKEIVKIMNSDYGKKVESWLRDNYKKI